MIKRQFKNFTWIVCDKPNLQDLTQIFTEYKIEDIEIQSILKQDSRAKLDIYKNYKYLKLNFLKYHKSSDSFSINEMHNILWDDFLITISTVPSRKLTSIIKQSELSGCDWIAEEFLHIILDKQVSKGPRIVDYIEEEINSLEKGVYDKITKNIIKLIAQKRKNITVLKHSLNINLLVLESLSKFFEKKSTDLKSTDLLIDYEYLVDKAHKAYQEVLILEDSVEGFDSTVKALFEVKNNDIIKKFTAYWFLFLPLNLIAWIFWMNIENVPFSVHFVVTVFLSVFFVMILWGFLLKKYIFD